VLRDAIEDKRPVLPQPLAQLRIGFEHAVRIFSRAARQCLGDAGRDGGFEQIRLGRFASAVPDVKNSIRPGSRIQGARELPVGVSDGRSALSDRQALFPADPDGFVPLGLDVKKHHESGDPDLWQVRIAKTW
jgi:hypothetical protein